MRFEAEVLAESPGEWVVHARWEKPRLDLGYMVFEPGDHFIEYYSTTKWYAIFEVRSQTGQLRGWYGNISSPARFNGAQIETEDLDLDLFVSPDRQTILRLDVEEFEARGVAASDPVAYAAAYAAFAELEHLARSGFPPFVDRPELVAQILARR
ncbi:MAG: DUF402 domain-containing protein [Roseiflexaceae bacterium]